MSQSGVEKRLIGHKISTASKLDKVQHRITISILISIVIIVYPAVEWLDLFYYPKSIISKDVRVIDGDTLILANKRIRLRGIDSPEIKQKCSGKYYRCGEIAKKELIGIIGNSEVKCSLGKKDKYKRILSYCAVKNKSLNYELIRLGLARTYINTNLLLRLAELRSRFNKVGIWSVGFYAPSDWRYEKLGQKK